MPRANKLILFSKSLATRTIEELADLAPQLGVDGYDLCVRPGHAVTPDNVAEALPKAADRLRRSGVDIPMITGNFDLLTADHPTAKPILAAAADAGVRLLKLGYFRFDPAAQSYAEQTEHVRRAFAGWEALSRQHGVKICYHTHSNRCMGLNCAALAHLLSDRDPACIGAYIDAGHMRVEGEEIATGVAMVRDHLSIVALKDVLLERREKNGHGSAAPAWVEAGKGMVDWTRVFESLDAVQFGGPLSVHCEFKHAEGELLDAIKREIAFFRRFVGHEAT